MLQTFLTETLNGSFSDTVRTPRKFYQERQTTYKLFSSCLKVKQGTWQFGTFDCLRSGKLLPFNAIDLRREQG